MPDQEARQAPTVPQIIELLKPYQNHVQQNSKIKSARVEESAWHALCSTSRDYWETNLVRQKSRCAESSSACPAKPKIHHLPGEMLAEHCAENRDGNDAESCRAAGQITLDRGVRTAARHSPLCQWNGPLFAACLHCPIPPSGGMRTSQIGIPPPMPTIRPTLAHPR